MLEDVTLILSIVIPSVLAWDGFRRYLASKKAKLTDDLYDSVIQRLTTVQESSDDLYQALDQKLVEVQKALMLDFASSQSRIRDLEDNHNQVTKTVQNLQAVASRRESLGPLTGAKRRKIGG